MFENAYGGKRVLVTGNTGFKGSWLCAWLLRLGAEVHGIADGVPTDPSMFEALGLRGRVEHTDLDIRDTEALAEAAARIAPDFVFHLAAQAIVSVSYDDPVGTLATNVMGTASVLEALRLAHRPCTAVVITSDKCYDNVEWAWGYRETDRLGGKDPYSASKGAAELVVRTYHYSFFAGDASPVRVLSARAGNVIGGGDWAPDRIVPDAVRAWSGGGPVAVRRPLATRPWQHVLEPLSGYLRAGQRLARDPGLAGESYNFGPAADQVHTVEQLLLAIGRAWGLEDETRVFTREGRQAFHEAGLLKLNCDKALGDLQWVPSLDFSRMAEFTARWYRCFYDDGGDLPALTDEQIDRYAAIARERGSAWTR